MKKTVSAKNGRMTRRAGHPLAPPSGIVSLARVTLYEKIGPGEHSCHWCGRTVKWMPGKGLVEGALMADHLDWDRLNDDPDNLVPSCNVCNSHRRKDGDHKRIAEGELFVVYGRKRERGAYRDCATCGEQFVARHADIRNGKGLYCSRSCARRAPRNR